MSEREGPRHYGLTLHCSGAVYDYPVILVSVFRSFGWTGGNSHLLYADWGLEGVQGVRWVCTTCATGVQQVLSAGAGRVLSAV